jgi:hypothetical protein
LRAWRYLLAGLILFWVFARLARGMAIFDDRKNISIVSTMAAGDIPPHHYMNAAFYFAYHYGFQLLGASLMRLGGLMPWSAYDLSKALVGAYTILLAALLGKRYISHPLGGLVTAGVFAFATGTRYLLLLAPAGLMARIDPVIFVRSVDEVVGMPLSQALRQNLVLGDGPPGAFSYAFMNGIGWPTVMAVHAGPPVLSFAILFLVWLAAPRMRGPASLVPVAILFSHSALVWESSYALFLGAGLLVGFIVLVRYRKRTDPGKQINPGMQVSPWAKWALIALLVSTPVALVQGGTITEFARKLLFGAGRLLPKTGEAASLGGFTLRWPPAIYSGHLSALSLFSPLQLLVAFFEVGPVILFTPWITWWAWKRTRQGDWMMGTFMISAWLGFLLPIFFSYEYDRDIVRFTKYGLLMWALILAIMLWDPATRWMNALRWPGIAALALMVFGGLAILGPELSAASQVVLTESDITSLDSLMTRDVWDQLPTKAEVFDPQTWRATMVTGRLTRVVEGNMSYDYAHSQVWEQLRANPSIELLMSDHFLYVYFDETWWSALSPQSQASLLSPCVKTVAQENGPSGEFRRLIDLSGCNLKTPLKGSGS